MKRVFLSVFTFVAAQLIITANLAGERPNVILIVSDDAGFSDIGAFGSEIETPNLDRLATEGLRFSQFYSNARCSPTRASLLTGRYPQSVGVGDLASVALRTDLPGYLGYLNPEGNQTLAEILKANGYNTIISGKWHLGGYPTFEAPLRRQTSPLGRGFDDFFGLLHGETSYTDTKRYVLNDKRYRPEEDKPFYATDAFVDFAISSISDLQSSTETTPFFLYLPFTAPHPPLEAPDELIEKYQPVYSGRSPSAVWERIRRERYDRAVAQGVIESDTPFRSDPIPTGQLDEIMRELPIHAAMMDRLDQNVGVLLDYLESSGALENSIIIYLSDNGARGEYHRIGNTPFYGRKADLWEGGMRTHFVMWSPAWVKDPGRVVKAPVHVIDVLPTLLDLLQINADDELDGESFAAALIDQNWASSRTLFWDQYGAQAVRQENWKYLKDRDGTEYLFDIGQDPTETTNLLASQPDKANALKELHKDWAAANNVVPYQAVKDAQATFKTNN